MYRMTSAALLTLISLACLIGCESPKNRLADLQSQYDMRMRQDWADCYALDLDKGNAPRVQKCKDEEAKITTLQNQITQLTQQLTK